MNRKIIRQTTPAALELVTMQNDYLKTRVAAGLPIGYMNRIVDDPQEIVDELFKQHQRRRFGTPGTYIERLLLWVETVDEAEDIFIDGAIFVVSERECGILKQVCSVLREIDPQIDQFMRRSAPEWFDLRSANPVDYITTNKTFTIYQKPAVVKELTPETEAQLAEALERYTDPSHPDYDPEFDATIRSARPDWFPPR